MSPLASSALMSPLSLNRQCCNDDNVENVVVPSTLCYYDSMIMTIRHNINDDDDDHDLMLTMTMMIMMN